MHSRKSNSTTDPFADTHQNHHRIMDVGCDGRQYGAHYIDGHREQHHVFGREIFGDPCTGNLWHEIAPEVAKAPQFRGSEEREKKWLLILQSGIRGCEWFSLPTQYGSLQWFTPCEWSILEYKKFGTTRWRLNLIKNSYIHCHAMQFMLEYPHHFSGFKSCQHKHYTYSAFRKCAARMRSISEWMQHCQCRASDENMT